MRRTAGRPVGCPHRTPHWTKGFRAPRKPPENSGFHLFWGFVRDTCQNENLREKFVGGLGPPPKTWGVQGLITNRPQDQPAAHLRGKFRREGGQPWKEDWRARALECLTKREATGASKAAKLPRLYRIASYHWLCVLDQQLHLSTTLPTTMRRRATAQQ